MAGVAISAFHTDHGLAFAALLAVAVFEFIHCDEMLVHVRDRLPYLITLAGSP